MLDFYDYKTLQITNTDEMYDIDNNITAYCVSFKNSSINAGYVIISKIDPENPIIEFSPSGESLIETLDKYTTEQINTNNIVPLYLGSGQIMAFYTEKGIDKIFEPNELKTYNKQSVSDKFRKNVLSAVKTIDKYKDIIKAFINKSKNSISSAKSISGGISDEPSGGINKREKRIPNLKLSEFKLMSELHSGGVCSPTAATNIMIYYKYSKNKTHIIKTSKQTTFNRLYKLMETTGSGGTYDNKVAPAYKCYIKECRYTSGVKVDSYWLNLWSDFTRDINNGLPIHTFLHVGNNGHSVVTVGWYIKRYGLTNYRYLQVISGWSRTIKYIPFNYFDSISGISIKI